MYFNMIINSFLSPSISKLCLKLVGWLDMLLTMSGLIMLDLVLSLEKTSIIL